MSITPKYRHASFRGFTLIELLVAMVLGIFLVGGVAGMYLETRKNMTQDDEMARLQENARYVIEVLRHEIASSGFFGGLNEHTLVSASPVGTDCAGTDWALDISTVMEMVNDYSSGAVLTSAGTTLTCLTAAELQVNSDIITVKRTADTPTLRDGVLSGDAEDINQWYLRSFDYSDYSWSYLTGTIPPDEKVAGSTYDYWEYYTRIFYLRNYSTETADGIPTFCEARLAASAMENRCLVEGVEEMHFEVGIDADDDGVAERYSSAPTAADFENAVAMRVHVMVRSINPVHGYTNNKSYRLGARTITPFNDGFIRKVFTTTVKLRNNLNS